MHIYNYFAQAYGCGSYGMESYSSSKDCSPAASTPTAVVPRGDPTILAAAILGGAVLIALGILIVKQWIRRRRS
jgi:hypothetical protein